MSRKPGQRSRERYVRGPLRHAHEMWADILDSNCRELETVGPKQRREKLPSNRRCEMVAGAGEILPPNTASQSHNRRSALSHIVKQSNLCPHTEIGYIYPSSRSIGEADRSLEPPQLASPSPNRRLPDIKRLPKPRFQTTSTKAQCWFDLHVASSQPPASPTFLPASQRRIGPRTGSIRLIGPAPRPLAHLTRFAPPRSSHRDAARCCRPPARKPGDGAGRRSRVQIVVCRGYSLPLSRSREASREDGLLGGELGGIDVMVRGKGEEVMSAALLGDMTGP